MTAECFRCGEPTEQRFGSNYLCEACTPESVDEDTESAGANPTPAVNESPASGREDAAAGERDRDSAANWQDAEFTDPESGVWATDHVERDQWMGHKSGDKQPFAPWADADAPVECSHHDEPTTCAECGHSARYKWGYEGNYTTHGEVLEWVDHDPRLAGLAFIQRDDDPLAFVDGDDVRDPETGDLHPVFEAFLNQLGVTYADISVSGAGVHAVYRGSLPQDLKQAVWKIDDEPWGANDDVPAIEIYDGKHVCVATGDHVPGTPTEAQPWDDDTLEAILQANDQLTDRSASAHDFDDFDPEDYDAGATESGERTDDIRDIYAALDRLDAQRVAERTIVDEWLEPSHADYRAFVPTWAPAGYDGTANFATSDVWKDSGTRGGKGGPACMAAIDAGLVSDRDCPERVEGETWWQAIDHLRSLGFDIPEYVPSDGVNDTDPAELKALDVTLDPEIAWRAADAVTPSELDADLSVPLTEDGAAWQCPRCEGEIGVVRAAAIDGNITTDCAAPLRDDAYARAYEHARRGLDAPLPEYVSRETATERWDIVRGAIRQLGFWHLEEDALNSEVTGRGDAVDGEPELTLDPAWRDSDSGESVLVFPSGTVYDAHPDHEDSLDALRFVGLDAGIIDWTEFTSDEYQLEGETFREVYSAARDYGAPLPRWEGTDAYHTAVLPSADDVVDDEDDVGDEDRLAAAYDTVGDLYTDAAERDEASLLRVLPGLGKTEQVFRNATEYPVLYTAGRKELMQDGVARATENGASSYILPVFAENGPPTVVTDTAEAVVREHGQRLLRDRWSLVERVREALPDGEELPDPEDLRENDDKDSVDLDRESCPVANGEYGVDWWVAVHAARARGYRPQQIHQNAAALFGADLPCTCGEDGEETTCAYTDAWETATDPDAPIDVLIGHYTHAHVEGARTYATMQNNRVQKRPRVVAVDEFPGEAYQREFGEEFPDLAAWLAGALREDVDDRQDVLRKAEDLWQDDTLRAWLDPDDTSDDHSRLAGVLGAAQAGLDAVDTAEWLLAERRDACDDLGITDALEALTAAHPGFDAGTVASVAGALTTAVMDDDNRGRHTNTLNVVDDLVDDLGGLQVAGDCLDADIADALGATTHVDGALASLVGDAFHAYRERQDSARRQLDAAMTALRGGPDGCEALAMHADDGYAHPLAHALLYGLLAPADDTDVATVRTSNFTFGHDEDTRLSSVRYQHSRVVLDRNHHGAVINHPPAFTAGGGQNPAVGLDATGRSTLWELALGREVTTRDIHDSMQERREFLREVYGLQMVQTSPHANSYEGDPSGKNFDDDVEVVTEVDRQYGDAVGQQPAVLTTKVVEETLEDRLSGVASATGHYGDLKGSNALADHRLAVLLGCQHYGDHVVERWAALAGEEATRTGHGMALDYNSAVANTALQHMREDQVMQAALRFGRDSDGAVVFAHTAAVRDDLPVVGDGEVVRTFSKQAQAIARAAGELARRSQFTASDVRDRVDGYDPSARTVRRVLSELSEFGYLERTETPNGYANEYSTTSEPRPAEVELPDIEGRAVDVDPGQDPLEVYYTWVVRVSPGDPRPARHRSVSGATLPAPNGGGGAETAAAPPG